jgi:hypothetical protein
MALKSGSSGIARKRRGWHRGISPSQTAAPEKTRIRRGIIVLR